MKYESNFDLVVIGLEYVFDPFLVMDQNKRITIDYMSRPLLMCIDFITDC